MQYWIKSAALLATLTVTTGCTVFENNAHHKKNYRINQPIDVPSDLKTPAVDSKYALAPVQYKNEQNDDALTPPAQILTQAKGSWIEEGEQAARVFFDKNEGVESLPQFLLEGIVSFANDNNIAIASRDDAKGEIITGPFAISEQEESWLFGDDEVPETIAIRFVVDTKSHGRSASITSHLAEFKSDSRKLSDLIKQQAEVYALNQVIMQLDYNYRQLLAKHRNAPVSKMSLGFDGDGNAAMQIARTPDDAFGYMSRILTALNFELLDAADDTLRFKVKYQEPDNTVWSSIWGDDMVKLPLVPGDYDIVITELNRDEANISWFNVAGQPLEPVKMEALVQAINEAINQGALN